MRLATVFKHLLCLCGMALLLTFPGPAMGSVRIVDDLGRTIELPRPAERIVPLYGAFSEMLYAIGAGGQVMARTQADRYPPEIVNLPSVGTHMRPNVEMIMGMKPDLVIQSATVREDGGELERLKSAGVPVAVFAPKTFADIFSAMERMGTLTGKDSEASTAATRLKERIEKVRSRLAESKKRPKVFFEVRAEPLTGAGRGSIVQEILTAAGAENILASDKAIVQYNFENLLLEDPDVYIVQEGPMNKNPMEPAKRAHYDRLRAVKEKKILTVDEFAYSRPGPRCVDAVEQLALKLYPDLF